MLLLSDLIQKTAANFSLGNKAVMLVSRTAAIMFNEQSGGLKGFLEKLDRLGLHASTRAWIVGNSREHPLDVAHVDSLIGAEVITATGREAGLANARVRAAMAFIIPELVHLFSDRGAPPMSMPGEVKWLLNGESDSIVTPVVRPAGMPSGKRSQTSRYKTAPTKCGRSSFWGWGVAVLLGTGFYLVYQMAGEQKAKPTEATPQASVTAPVQPAEPTQVQVSSRPASRLTLRNMNGAIEFHGVVNDPGTKAMVINKLKGVFGAERVNGNLAVNPLLDAPPWLFALDRLLPRLGVSGMDIRLDGLTVMLGGWLSDADRQSLLDAVKPTMGSSFQYGFLRDEASELVLDSHDQTLLGLITFNQAGTGEELAKVLNGWMIGFAPGSAEFPQSGRDIASRTAYLMRSLAHPVVFEVAGYVDTQGTPDSNVQLSLARATSVREALTSAGAPDWMLKAKGYGDSRPLMASTSDYGRFRNRRIEFSVVQQCDAAHPCAPPQAPATVVRDRPLPPAVPFDQNQYQMRGDAVLKPDAGLPGAAGVAPVPAKPKPKAASKPVTIQELF